MTAIWVLLEAWRGEFGLHLSVSSVYSLFCTQESLLALLKGLDEVPGIEPWLAIFKASVLPIILVLQPLKHFLVMGFWSTPSYIQDILLAVHFRGISSDGVWGIICGASNVVWGWSWVSLTQRNILFTVLSGSQSFFGGLGNVLKLNHVGCITPWIY